MNLALYQSASLAVDEPEHNLKKGDMATLVDFAPHPSGGERGCVLEVFNAVGESLEVIVIPESRVKPLRADEILSIRRMGTVG